MRCVVRWVEPDVINRRPVPGMARPAGRVGALSVLVDPVPVRQDRDVLPAMTLAGGDEADLAVTMFLRCAGDWNCRQDATNVGANSHDRECQHGPRPLPRPPQRPKPGRIPRPSWPFLKAIPLI